MQHELVGTVGRRHLQPGLPKGCRQRGGYLNHRLEQILRTMTFERNLAADDVIYHVEQSEDLVTWLWGTAVAFVSRHNQNDGTVLETWRSTAPISVQNTQFLRLNVTGRPGPAP
ncbi:MAG: hypothetical protein ACKJSK_01960 [Roseibacillus sp.]